MEETEEDRKFVLSSMEEDREIKYLKHYQAAKTAVFWDLQDCRIRDGLSVFQVSQNIKSALEDMYYSGPVSFYLYGDTNQNRGNIQSTRIVKDCRTGSEGEIAFDHKILEYRRSLSFYADETQAEFNHADSKSARLEMILVHMLSWAMKNPSPANLMIIVGDISEYKNCILAFHHLLSSSHNIFFVQPNDASAPPALPITFKIVWDKLSTGEVFRVRRDRSQPEDIEYLVRQMLQPRSLVRGAGALAWMVFSSWLRGRSQ